MFTCVHVKGIWLVCFSLLLFFFYSDQYARFYYSVNGNVKVFILC